MKNVFKKTISILLVTVMVLCSAPLAVFVGLELPSFGDLFNIRAKAATSGTCGENLTWCFDVETGTLTISGTGAMADFCVDPLKGYSDIPWKDYTINEIIIAEGVTSIGDFAFYDCTSLTSVTIPDSVTSIGDNAFSHWTSLTSVTIPDSVTSIGDGAFSYCTSLTSITIPDSVTSIGDYAFSYCTSLINVTIGDGITFLGYSVFYNTAIYNDITKWENDVLYIGKYLIDAKNTISDSYKIKEGTLIVESFAFAFCTSLTSVTIPDSVTSIGQSAFYDCTSLTSITIPDSVTSIGVQAFKDCTSLKNVTIGNSVTNIGLEAFSNCDRLTSITIPDSVTSIGDGAFSYCDNLISVIIGNGVKSIGNSVFGLCTALEYVHIPASVTSIGSVILHHTYSYICSETKNCYAKAYADKNGIEFSICFGHGSDGHCHMPGEWETMVESGCISKGKKLNTVRNAVK